MSWTSAIVMSVKFYEAEFESGPAATLANIIDSEFKLMSAIYSLAFF